jgi:2-dehydro-3-deoxygluconokinase
MTMQLLCVGEAMAELRQESAGFAVGFAGDSFNTAVYCSRVLKTPGAVGYLTRVGKDPLSQGFLQLARAEGLDCAAIGRDPERNIGIYTVQTDQAGERSFHYWRADSAARRLFHADDEFVLLGQCRLLYFSAITLAILPAAVRARFLDRVAELRRTHGIAVAFDSNYRPRLWESAETAREVVDRAWCLTDIALPSLDDEMALFGDADEDAILARLLRCGCRRGALKRAAAGPLALEELGCPLPRFAPAEHVLDSTAAGDSFNGAYLAGVISGADVVTCLSWGHELARQVVAKRGAIVDVALSSRKEAAF